MVERWKGTPQTLPPVWLLAMKAGKKLFSQALSSSVFTKASMGVIASSSMRVNMSVESCTERAGGAPLLWAVSTFTSVS